MIIPKQIFKNLSTDVIGQNKALQEMSVAIYKHLIEHSVGNVLMIGNSGTGKTTIMKSMERFFDESTNLQRYSTTIRINANLVADLASKGAQTNVVMDRLASAAATMLDKEATLEAMIDYISHGIVCVDEVDKIRAKVGDEANVKGIVAQDSLLTLMENENVQVNVPHYENGTWQKTSVPINTKHVLFVAGGAFEELYTQVYNRVTDKGGLSNLTKLVPKADGSLERRVVFRLGDHVTHEDLFDYGMTPQFLARFESIIMLGDLSAPDLVQIFKDIPNAIWPTAVDYFKQQNIALTISEDALLAIADRAADKNRLGARALAEVFGKIIKQFEYDPDSNEHITDGANGKELALSLEMIKPFL